jgi:hypothetical protein
MAGRYVLETKYLGWVYLDQYQPNNVFRNIAMINLEKAPNTNVEALDRLVKLANLALENNLDVSLEG